MLKIISFLITFAGQIFIYITSKGTNRLADKSPVTIVERSRVFEKRNKSEDKYSSRLVKGKYMANRCIL